ncbi:hypothetical protein [Bacillus paramobilis]|uniref:hypothetical protein n=1 Tax=Bacillus paramobilis TaxID=2817477 RepID=UPI00300BAE7C
MIELVTVNGCRRLIKAEHIVQIGELSNEKASRVVITLSTGETVFTTNSYEFVKEQYLNVMVIANA